MRERSWIAVGAAAVALFLAAIAGCGGESESNISDPQFRDVGSAGLDSEEEVLDRFGDGIEPSQLARPVRGMREGCHYYYYNDAAAIYAEICFEDGGFRSKAIVQTQ